MTQDTHAKSPLVALMDDFYLILTTRPIEDSPLLLSRRAGLAPSNALAIEALARLLVVEHARRRHMEAQLAEASPEAQGEAQ